MGNEASSMQSGKADEVALTKAILAGDVSSMQSQLQQKPALIYAHSKDGENIWHAAAQGGHVEAVKAVSAAVGAVLASQKKQDRLKAQVNHGLNQVNQAMNQVISSAVPLPSALNLPMGASLDINAQTREGLTPLMSAVKAGNVEVAQQLLELGADAWLGDNSGATALHHASWLGETGCMQVLLGHADKVEGQWSSTGSGATCDAVKLLVNAGAAIAAPSNSDTMERVAANAGSTPLHLAAMKGDAGVIRLLLRANKKLMGLAAADPNLAAAADSSSGTQGDLRKAADVYGKTAGRLAWDMQRSDLALILDPKTPLDQAIQLAAAATKTAATAAAVTADAAPEQQQQCSRPSPRPLQQEQQKQQPHVIIISSSMRGSGGRQPGVAAVDVTAATAATTAATDQEREDSFFGGFVSGGARPAGPEPPEHLKCPITNELLKDPVRGCDGVAYERDAIEVWFQLGNTMFPGGRTRISSTALTPDEALKQEAAAWKAAQQQQQ